MSVSSSSSRLDFLHFAAPGERVEEAFADAATALGLSTKPSDDSVFVWEVGEEPATPVVVEAAVVGGDDATVVILDTRVAADGDARQRLDLTVTALLGEVRLKLPVEAWYGDALTDSVKEGMQENPEEPDGPGGWGSGGSSGGGDDGDGGDGGDGGDDGGVLTPAAEAMRVEAERRRREQISAINVEIAAVEVRLRHVGPIERQELEGKLQHLKDWLAKLQ